MSNAMKMETLMKKWPCVGEIMLRIDMIQAHTSNREEFVPVWNQWRVRLGQFGPYKMAELEKFFSQCSEYEKKKLVECEEENVIQKIVDKYQPKEDIWAFIRDHWNGEGF